MCGCSISHAPAAGTPSCGQDRAPFRRGAGPALGGRHHLILFAASGIPGEPEHVARLFPFTLAALLAGPSVAGVAMTVLVSGKGGLRELLARLVRWCVSARWWAAALLTGPVLVAAVLFGLPPSTPPTSFLAFTPRRTSRAW
jgi:hypothetical protein